MLQPRDSVHGAHLTLKRGSGGLAIEKKKDVVLKLQKDADKKRLFCSFAHDCRCSVLQNSQTHNFPLVYQHSAAKTLSQQQKQRNGRFVKMDFSASLLQLNRSNLRPLSAQLLTRNFCLICFLCSLDLVYRRPLFSLTNIL